MLNRLSRNLEFKIGKIRPNNEESGRSQKTAEFMKITSIHTRQKDKDNFLLSFKTYFKCNNPARASSD